MTTTNKATKTWAATVTFASGTLLVGSPFSRRSDAVAAAKHLRSIHKTAKVSVELLTLK